MKPYVLLVLALVAFVLGFYSAALGPIIFTLCLFASICTAIYIMNCD